VESPIKFLTYALAFTAVTLMVGCTTMQPQPAPIPAPIPTPAPVPVPAPSPEPIVARTAPPFEGLSVLEIVLKWARAHEGLRLQAYQGHKGKWLIGYGHGGNVRPGMTITRTRAEELLREDLNVIGDYVKSVVKVPLSAAEFSAMVTLALNIGTGNFGQSTLLRKLNEGDREGAADGFLLWTMTRQHGELVVNPQLTQRRSAERALFLGN
jgi:lysozyme